MQTNTEPDHTLPGHPITDPPPTRELTEHQFNELFEDFFNPDLGELALCKLHELSLNQLYEIFTSERFQLALKRLESIRQLRAQHQASLIQRDALAGLHNLTHARAPNATCAEASRKACMALLKLIPTPGSDKSSVLQDPPPFPTGEVAPKVTEGVFHSSSERAATVRERSASSSSSPVSSEPYETERAPNMTDATPKVTEGAPFSFLSLEGEVDGTDRFWRVRGSSSRSSPVSNGGGGTRSETEGVFTSLLPSPGPGGAIACSHGRSTAQPVDEILNDASPRRGEGPHFLFPLTSPAPDRPSTTQLRSAPDS